MDYGTVIGYLLSSSMFRH